MMNCAARLSGRPALTGRQAIVRHGPPLVARSRGSGKMTGMDESNGPFQFGVSQLFGVMLAAALSVGAYRVHPVLMPFPVLICVTVLPERWAIVTSVCFLLILLPLAVSMTLVAAAN